MNNTAESLVINADTNASFVGSGKFSDVVLNWASSGASIVSQATQVRLYVCQRSNALRGADRSVVWQYPHDFAATAMQAVIQKSGSGNIYIPQAITNLQLVQSGKGVSSFAAVDTVCPAHCQRLLGPLDTAGRCGCAGLTDMPRRPFDHARMWRFITCHISAQT